MQRDAADLARTLLRALDDRYNVVDMPAVLEVISVLEKISISKELLQSSRLGKYVNEVRRNTTDEQLARRTRDLVKRWRNEFIAASESAAAANNGALPNQPKRGLGTSPAAPAATTKTSPAVVVVVDSPQPQPSKRARLNGNAELDLSDTNSNSSFKDAIRGDSVIVVNSDSNSSLPDNTKSEEAVPKKRGRKKGSKNHKSLLDEAETSFSNKMAVSRGNAKVKTTQELIAGLRDRNNTNSLGLSSSVSKVKEDLIEKAAKLTERVSIIDQKLYNTNINNFRRRKQKVLESGVVTNLKGEEPNFEDLNLIKKIDDDEVIIVDEDVVKSEEPRPDPNPPDFPRALTIEEALRILPPINRDEPQTSPEEPQCTCRLNEATSEFEITPDCPAAAHLTSKYRLDQVSEDEIRRLLTEPVPNLNGNPSLGPGLGPPEIDDSTGLYRNVVPRRGSERIPRYPLDDIKKYRISEAVEADSEGFREWNEVVEVESYNGETMRVLPYVVID